MVMSSRPPSPESEAFGALGDWTVALNISHGP